MPKLNATTIGGIVGGGVGGASAYLHQKAQNKENKGRSPTTRDNPKLTGLLGVPLGVYLGSSIGAQNSKNVRAAYSQLKSLGFKSNAHHIGTAAGAAAGGYSSYKKSKAMNEEASKDRTKSKMRPKANSTAAALYGGLLGGAAGHSLGSTIRGMKAGTFAHAYNRARGNGAPKPKMNIGPPSWAKSAKTKDEAKKAFRAEAMKHHPDRGGDTKKMQDLNKEWDNFKNSHHFDKLSSVLDSFLVELFRIYSE